MAVSSPEEEMEMLEEEEAGTRRPVLPSSAFRDLLQASPTRRSTGSRTATLTPIPGETLPKEGPQLGRYTSPTVSTAHSAERPATSVSSATTSYKGSVIVAEERIGGPDGHQIDKLETKEEVEEEKQMVQVSEQAPEFGNAAQDLNEFTTTHGPPKPFTETITIESESDRPDASPSISSSRTSVPPRPRRIRSVKGTPFVDLTFVPLNQLRNWELWEGCRYPSALSRHDQVQYNQTPPSSSRSSSEAGPSRPRRSGNYPTWAVMEDEESSDDLGGYGTVGDSEEDDELISLSDGGDEIVVSKRSTRGKGKAKEVARRSTRSGVTKPKTYRQSTDIDFTASRSTSYSRDSRNGSSQPRRGRPSKGKGKARDMDVSSDEDYESEVDEPESESDGSEFGVKPRVRATSGSKGETTSDFEVTEDVLYRHRNFCEKCRRGPADVILQQAKEKKKRSKGKKRKRDEDVMSDEDVALELEGWLTCKRCVVACHWGCLAASQKKDVLIDLQAKEGPVEYGRRKIRGVEIHEEATFTCSKCSSSLGCLVCHKDKLPQQVDEEAKSVGLPHTNGDPGRNAANGHDQDIIDVNGDIDMSEALGDPKEEEDPSEDEQDEESFLRFRCFRCKQEAHYEHLPDPFEEDVSLAEIADYYQQPTEKKGDAWECHQCRTWIWTVDIIIGWRPLPAGANENLRSGEVANYKDDLPREYLVKWTNRGFRHVTWVPHPWLLAASALKLRNFLEKGPSLNLVTDETLAARGDDMAEPTISNLMEEADAANNGPQVLHKASQHTGDEVKDTWVAAGPAPDINAESSIPIAWSVSVQSPPADLQLTAQTIDRILDVMVLPPVLKPKGKGKANTRTNLNASADLSIYGDATKTMDDGVEPHPDQRVSIDDWERKASTALDESDVHHVAKMVTWCYIKWDDLQYDQSTWDTPPPLDSPLYPAYKAALGRYLRDRKIQIPILSGKECETREDKAAKWTRPPKTQPGCIVGGMNGFQWLLTKYFKRESCILADDMGLGKTIQIASLLGFLGSAEHKTYPFLVVVPNSTITNWVREFEKWVPHMRVLKQVSHVVLTTYDVITGVDFSLFSKIPRWEMLIVDEGQRLKSDSNLIFNRLKTLNTVHRILLTGTPLNNNLRELFNLLNFLDPVHFKHLNDLEEKFSDLNENLLAELHTMIQPYILRRIKADVLRLPPKIEIIVPISLTPMQKKIYRGILERHTDLLQAVLQQKKKRAPKPKPVIEGGGVIEPVQTEQPAGIMALEPPSLGENSRETTVAQEPGEGSETINAPVETLPIDISPPGVAAEKQVGEVPIKGVTGSSQDDQSDRLLVEDAI